MRTRTNWLIQDEIDDDDNEDGGWCDGDVKNPLI